MQAIDLLLRRRSAKALTGPGPDEEALALMLESAAHAPDHGRLRPWRFIVIRGPARERFGELLAGQLKRARPAATAEALERERQKAFRAPLIIAVAAMCEPIAKVPQIEQVLAAGAAAGYLLLAAKALGFNAVWKTGAAAYDETIKTALGLSAADTLVAFIHVGTEAAGAAAPAPAGWRDRVMIWNG